MLNITLGITGSSFRLHVLPIPVICQIKAGAEYTRRLTPHESMHVSEYLEH